MIKGQFGWRPFAPAIMADAGGYPVAPPLGASEIAGFLPLTAQLLLGDIGKEGHDERIQNSVFRIQEKNNPFPARDCQAEASVPVLTIDDFILDS
jgi:hypothetical protein